MIKKTILFLFLAMITGSKLYAQVKPEDQLLGVWFNEDKDGKIEIYKNGKQYFGKLIWAKDMYQADGHTSVKDNENPDPKLKTRDLKDVVILTGFSYDKNIWKGGNIYDPDNGKTYTCEIELINGELHVRGYVWIFHRTETWTRVP